MKTFLLFVILSTISFILAEDITIVDASTPNFLLGTWKSIGNNIPDDLSLAQCCMPQGTINIAKDPTNSSQVILTASEWTGKLCNSVNQILVGTSSQMMLPFSGSATFNDISGLVESNNQGGMGFILSDLNFEPTEDQSDKTVQTPKFNLAVDFSHAKKQGSVLGDNCQSVLSKTELASNSNENKTSGGDSGKTGDVPNNEDDGKTGSVPNDGTVSNNEDDGKTGSMPNDGEIPKNGNDGKIGSVPNDGNVPNDDGNLWLYIVVGGAVVVVIVAGVLLYRKNSSKNENSLLITKNELTETLTQTEERRSSLDFLVAQSVKL